MIHYRISGGRSVREDLFLVVAAGGFEQEGIEGQSRKGVIYLRK